MLTHALTPADLDSLKRKFPLAGAPDDGPPDDGYQGPTDYPESADSGPTVEPLAPSAPPSSVGRLTQPLKLTYFDDCGKTALRRWILKGIIARNETSGWVAPPGAGKSTLLTEIAIHCAARIDWRGHRAKEACGVVVFALERADLFKRRLDYYRQRDGLHGLPIAVVDVVVDLLNPACVATIVATVREAERNFGCDAGMLIFDTYNKGIAAGGGDEDKAKDQNRAAANLRNIHGRLENNVHIALVGHTGKDESRGARGSNAHVGDVDVMVQISGDSIKIAQVIKGNDQPERTVAEFKMEVVETGRDEDDEPVTTSIVSVEHFEPVTSSDRGPAKSKTAKLRDIPKAALHALHECVARSGAAARRPTRPGWCHMSHTRNLAGQAAKTRAHQRRRQLARAI
jgi:hypothetical protein